MAKHYIHRKLSKKELLDVATMQYFIPTGSKRRIYPNDKKKMSDLSSHGIKPKRETPGYKLLIIGKMYRDLQITSYKEDIELGFFTKYEIISSFPKKLQPWIESKIKKVPYDSNGDTSRMFIGMYKIGDY